MLSKAVLYVLASAVILLSLSPVKWAVSTCSKDNHCASNKSSLCCFGVCKEWWKCKGGCLSDDSCKEGKVCHLNRCSDENIIFPEFCKSKEDCGEGKECESNQCKPAPRLVVDETAHDFHSDIGVVVIVGTVVGGLAFFVLTAYCSYRCFKRRRWRMSARRTNSFHPSRYSASDNAIDTYDLYHQPVERISSYPQRPPPPYDSVTLDLEEFSSPPPYVRVVEG